MKRSITQGIDILKSGGVLAIPTETVYGLAADAMNVEAVQKTFALKGRPADNPLIVHIAGLDQLHQIAETIPEEAALLADAFWPGPLTLVLPKKPAVPDIVTAGLPTVAVRMPDHPIALQIIEKAGPLTAPSANKSGRPSPTRIEHLVQDFGQEIDFVDGGECTIGIESTVLDLTERPFTVLRPGAISASQLSGVIGESVATAPDSGRQGRSPGTRYVHYKPAAAVRWLDPEGEPEANTLYILHSGSLSFHGVRQVEFNRDYNAMARQLYDLYRRADANNLTAIYIEKFPKNFREGLLQALINRIQRSVGE
ncbi:MAG: L-threonylcarbamoyladenylate synthase [Balneolaceae bacterium]